MKFTVLAGKIALGSANPKDYTDWAMSLLENGSDSESIAILAGLGFENKTDSEEVRYYFNKCLNELGLELPFNESSILSSASYICSEIVEGNIPPKNGLSILDSLYSETDYEAIYSIWGELDEDIWFVNDQEGAIFNSGLTKTNIEEYTVKVAKQFIQLTKIDLPKNFFQLTVCQKCGNIGESRLERIDKPWLPEKVFRLIYKMGPTMRSICSKCNQPLPLNMGDYLGREQYIKVMK